MLNFNTFKWADVFAFDLAGAKEYYSGLFGWHFTDQYSEGKLVYSLGCMDASANPPESTSVAGVAPKWETEGEPCPRTWESYVLVESVDETAKKVTANGGSIAMGPMDVMEAGRMAVCTDNRGIAFNLWQPHYHTGARIEKVPGTLTWFELTTTDIQVAGKFYGAVFDWSLSEGAVGDQPYWVFKKGDFSVGGLHTRIEETGGQQNWMPYFLVEDIVASLKRSEYLNGSTIFGPFNEPDVGLFAVAADAEGNLFGLAQYTNPNLPK